MTLPKDIPTVIDEIDRLQKITPKRLDRLAQKTELILRSVDQVGLVSNSTIRQLDRLEKPDTLFDRLDERLIWGLMIMAGIATMIFSSFVTDLILNWLLRYFKLQ